VTANANTRATTATVPTRISANRASEEAWRNQFPGATPPPGAIQPSQLLIIRLAASLRDSLSSDNGSPPIAS
jgi:hypothetical protein